jgi:hypothetical protein
VYFPKLSHDKHSLQRRHLEAAKQEFLGDSAVNAWLGSVFDPLWQLEICYATAFTSVKAVVSRR